MEKIIWSVQPQSAPAVLRYCKKCGRKTEFFCSGQFRVNAQRRRLDVWLIYKCASCSTTWNLEIYSRVSPQSLPKELLDGFHRNSEALAARYAADMSLLQKAGAEVKPPQYIIEGKTFSAREAVELTIDCAYPLPVKVSSLVREKLHLTNKEYTELVKSGALGNSSGQDLLKRRLGSGIVLIFNKKTSPDGLPEDK